MVRVQKLGMFLCEPAAIPRIRSNAPNYTQFVVEPFLIVPRGNSRDRLPAAMCWTRV
jgi:hypothetical protein